MVCEEEKQLPYYFKKLVKVILSLGFASGRNCLLVTDHLRRGTELAISLDSGGFIILVGGRLDLSTFIKLTNLAQYTPKPVHDLSTLGDS